MNIIQLKVNYEKFNLHLYVEIMMITVLRWFDMLFVIYVNHNLRNSSCNIFLGRPFGFHTLSLVFGVQPIVGSFEK